MRAGLLLSLLIILSACKAEEGEGPGSSDQALRRQLAAAEVTPLTPPPLLPEPLDRLGQALFFDKILSGNRDIGCSTCHNPIYHTSDRLMLSIGTGGNRPGGSRALGTGGFTTRHATDLFDRGQPEWHTLMWDGRIATNNHGLDTPLGTALPPGLSGPLAAQALLPLLARVEMRGHGVDELATLPDTAIGQVYDAIAARVRAVPGYDSLFAAAYPGLPPDSMNIARLVNALAAFITDHWSTLNSPFDRYLRGDSLALSESQHRGADLFFGRARCGECHRGPLLTDQQFHNTGLPTIGPGLLAGGPDVGRAAVTGRAEDRYRFRTAPLRNASITPPYMHNGTLGTLDEVVRHYRNARESLSHFDPVASDARLQSTLDLSAPRIADILSTLDPRLATAIPLSERDIADLVAFLSSLTDPAAATLIQDIPASVPSGLPILD
jgi:cytochrome c peroxidase